jgi:hypothetical protein
VICCQSQFGVVYKSWDTGRKTVNNYLKKIITITSLNIFLFEMTRAYGSIVRIEAGITPVD